MPPSRRESEVPIPRRSAALSSSNVADGQWLFGQEAAAPAQQSECVPTLYMKCTTPHAWPHPPVLCGQGVTARIAVASAAELRQLLHERLDDVLAKCHRHANPCCCGRIVMRGLNVRDGLGVGVSRRRKRPGKRCVLTAQRPDGLESLLVLVV